MHGKKIATNFMETLLLQQKTLGETFVFISTVFLLSDFSIFFISIFFCSLALCLHAISSIRNRIVQLLLSVIFLYYVHCWCLCCRVESCTMSLETTHRIQRANKSKSTRIWTKTKKNRNERIKKYLLWCKAKWDRDKSDTDCVVFFALIRSYNIQIIRKCAIWKGGKKKKENTKSWQNKNINAFLFRRIL